MLSTELENAADWAVKYAAKGLPMPPHVAAHFAKILMDLSHQARQLERLPVDVEALLDD